MATAVRKHAIINRGQRRAKAKKHNRARRHMSAKQIRHFGTKAQRRALKARSKANRSKSSRRNAHRARSIPRKKKRNPESILSLQLGNTGRSKMAAHKKRKKSSSHARHHNRPRKRNRGMSHVRHHNYRHRRHNVGGMGAGEISGLAVEAVAAVGGFVGSRWLTQLVLSASNVGIMGYFGNAVATALLGVAAHYVAPRNRNVRDGVILGGAMGIVARVVEDYTPFGEALKAQGFGDYGMAAYMPTNSVIPQRYIDAWRSSQVEVPSGWGGTNLVVAGAGMSGDAYGGGNPLDLY
jgi:hypothetical protein